MTMKKDEHTFSPADLQAAQLVEQGAVLMLPTELPETINALIGAWVRIDDRRSFWFAAGGTDQSAAHVLEYDEARMPHAHAVSFHHNGELVGYLTTIAESDAREEDEMKAQFTAWQSQRDMPHVRDFIQDQFEDLTRN